MTRRRILVVASALIAVLVAVPVATAFGDDSEDDRPTSQAATALTTAFTYQGRLLDAGAPANASYDMRFILYDAESGGAQVGDTVTKTSVAVAAGLFTTSLDFGAVAFTGDARWLEIAVKPAGGGTYLVLNPRQPITATPYALYAKAAGLAIPFAASAASAVNLTSTGLFTLTQTDTGIALAGKRTYTGATEAPAIYGSNTGAGPAVQGESTYAGLSGAGGKFSGTTVALELGNGALRVSGLISPAAFQHTVSVGTLCAGSIASVIDSPLTNLDATAMIIVTPVVAGASSVTAPTIASPVLAYSPSGCALAANKWAIMAMATSPLSLPGTLVVGNTFNVLVIKK